MGFSKLLMFFVVVVVKLECLKTFYLSSPVQFFYIKLFLFLFEDNSYKRKYSDKRKIKNLFELKQIFALKQSDCVVYKCIVIFILIKDKSMDSDTNRRERKLCQERCCFVLYIK